ncbi:MAG: hypothetical protein JRN20_19650 [Nitrososphaerota archaeon]|nr:hypothetical protein [Nitrososphaerota archaeon]
MKIDYSQHWDRIKFWKKVVEERSNFLGSSPPAVFVGSTNYPKVSLGILAPPMIMKDASILDAPDVWYKSKAGLSDIVDYRSRMVYSRSHVNDTSDISLNKLVEAMQELAMSSTPLDVDIKLSRRPQFAFSFDTYSTPIGNPAPIERVKVIDNATVERSIDKAVHDPDLRAVEAIQYLRERAPMNQVQKMLSVGMLGLKKQRKLVPTRWAITAVDSAMGDEIVDKVKQYHEIDKPMIFRNEYLFNTFQVLLLPRSYQYELIEIDITESTEHPTMTQDFEPYGGRTSYASETAGGFYAARYSVLKALDAMHRQASVIVVREIHPEYSFPVGVWAVRSNVAGAMNSVPETLEDEKSAFQSVSSNCVTSTQWMSKSRIYKWMKEQTTLTSLF